MKALVLFSGGLDSLLAMKIIQKTGIELFALNFVSPFCRCHRKDGCSAVAHLKALGIGYRLVSLSEEYLQIVAHPKFGRGSNMNPCLDCRIMMFKKAKDVMEDIGARFIITGEVLGQRPMSQQRRQLELIEKEAGLSGLVLRPLSARVLPQSLPEKEGWVSNEALQGLSGRMRSPQINMARELGLKDYPCPAGGCLLTDKNFSRRLNDLMRYGELTMPEVELLKLGRHFRLNDKSKLVVGRNERENERLLSLVNDGDTYFVSNELPGPVGVIRKSQVTNHKLQVTSMERAATIVAYYCDGDSRDFVILSRHCPKGKINIKARPADKPQVEKLRVENS
ncbi:MAG: hypothetical protein ACE5GG_00065 [Candidatus Omnitrophota bacterium]